MLRPFKICAEGPALRRLFDFPYTEETISTDPDYLSNRELVDDFDARMARMSYFWSRPVVVPKGTRDAKITELTLRIKETLSDLDVVYLIAKHCVSSLYSARGTMRFNLVHQSCPVVLAANLPLPLTLSLDVFAYMLAQIVGTTFAVMILRLELAEHDALSRGAHERLAHPLTVLHKRIGAGLMTRLGRLAGVEGFVGLCLFPPSCADVLLDRPTVADNCLFETTSCQPAYAWFLNLGPPVETDYHNFMWRSWMQLYYASSRYELDVFASEMSRVFDKSVDLKTYGVVAAKLKELVRGHGLRIREGVVSCNYALVPAHPHELPGLDAEYDKSPLAAWIYVSQIFTRRDDAVNGVVVKPDVPMFGNGGTVVRRRAEKSAGVLQKR